MIETDQGLRGFYRCAYGTLNCYNMNETGKIVDAKLSGAQFTARVMLTSALQHRDGYFRLPKSNAEALTSCSFVRSVVNFASLLTLS